MTNAWFRDEPTAEVEALATIEWLDNAFLIMRTDF
jgi:hypothetical protein